MLENFNLFGVRLHVFILIAESEGTSLPLRFTCGMDSKVIWRLRFSGGGSGARNNCLANLFRDDLLDSRFEAFEGVL